MNDILQGSRIAEWLVPELSVHVEAILGHHAEHADDPTPVFVPISPTWRDWEEEDLVAYHSVRFFLCFIVLELT
jgi:hypothetical protein